MPVSPSGVRGLSLVPASPGLALTCVVPLGGKSRGKSRGGVGLVVR